MMSKRIAIKKVLEEKFTIYNIGVLDKEAKLSLPFLILEMTGERRAMHNHFITFSVFVYAPIKAPLMLDESVKQVKTLLYKRRIKSNNGDFFVEYMGANADFASAKLQAIGKVLEFKIPLV